MNAKTKSEFCELYGSLHLAADLAEQIYDSHDRKKSVEKMRQIDRILTDSKKLSKKLIKAYDN